MEELRATEFLDHESAEVRALVDRVTDPAMSPVAQAVALYYAVRDRLRYEVYGADLSRGGLRASTVLRTGSGMCLHKSVVYAAALRAVGVPSRLVLTDVRNHLASDRLRALVGGDMFTYHCLVSVHLDGQWIKATPVFNKTLCRLYRMAPLEFDGTGDSLYHPFDEQGRQQMEFVRTHGEFPDLPYERVIAGLRAAHPKLFDEPHKFAAGSLVADTYSTNTH
ncbi:MAG TPA: transglutaminase-like domain-containing protein [Actinokineospora sp.]|jgi:transglutaminase-like putative cysteine protease|nr:transglutaminase-like domain-containing protein [Actinokineospora sp.]